jgi:hypothetical protein
MRPIAFARPDDDFFDDPQSDFDYHGGCVAPHAMATVRLPA